MLLAVGAGFLYATRRLRQPARSRPAAWTAPEAGTLHLAGAGTGGSAPLPEEVKLELQHMVREVWEAAS